MNFNDLLGGVLNGIKNNNQNSTKGDLLSSVLGAVNGTASQGKSDVGSLLNSVLGTVGKAKSGDSDAITQLGGGTALVGLLSMLLGRQGGANLTKLGSLAVLGGMAYKAYQAYQQGQGKSAENEIQPFSEAQSDAGNLVILQAMVAAAYADGELDDNEQRLLEQEAQNHPALAELVSQPASPAEIAQSVGNNPALAAQVYLAARLVCQELSRAEILFLDQLAKALNIAPELAEQLEKQAGF